MLLSCFLFSGMGTLVYRAQLAEPEASTLVGSFVRIVFNLLFLLVWARLAGNFRELFGDRRPSLWLRGMFGTLALTTSFLSIRAIGLGEASFLHASNAVFVALLAPWFLRQRSSPQVWLAIFGAAFGLYLLFEPRLGDAAPWGRALALVSGLASALAYMMIARAGRSNLPESVVFYFCIVCVTTHLLLFALLGVTWPKAPLTWAMLAVAGLLGSFGQIYLTKAYQTAPAALNGAVAYLQPVLNLGIAVLFFAKHPDAKAWLGAAIVLAFGVALPFFRTRASTSATR